MQTSTRHFPTAIVVTLAITVAAAVMFAGARNALAQDDLVTADPADLLAISQLTLGMDPVEACGDSAAQCVIAGGIPHADGGWEKSCKDSRKIISLAARGKMKPIHKGVCKTKYLVVDADQEGQPTLRYADYATYGGKECKRWPDASARTTMTEEEVEIAALEGRLVGASKLRGALFKWFKAQSNPPPFSALPLTTKKKIDPTQWDFGVISPTCDCQCGAWEMVDAVVNNARRGDVAIVSITDGKGDDAVSKVMRSLSQNHRHALMFTSNDSVRHSTQFLMGSDIEPPVEYSWFGYDIWRPWEGGDPRICTWESEEPKWGTIQLGNGTPTSVSRWPDSYQPEDGPSISTADAFTTNDPDLSGEKQAKTTKLQPRYLRNGLPGVISQSLSQAIACERISHAGLVLTHGLNSESSRATFEKAAGIAETESGYYKISEYSGLGQWDNLQPIDNESVYFVDVIPSDPLSPYETAKYREDNLKGTHCSGFVRSMLNAALIEDGRAARIEDFRYSSSLRLDVAKTLYSTLYDELEEDLIKQVASKISGLQNICVLWNCKKLIGQKVAENIANQIVNCFAGVGDGACTDETDTWNSTATLGERDTVAPDNLLPDSFTLKTPGGTGSTGWCTSWDDYSETQNVYVPGYTKPVGQIPFTRDSLCPGDLVNWDIGHEAGQDTANFPSPFKRVEPLVLAGSTWTYADVPMLGDWAQTLPGAP